MMCAVLMRRLRWGKYAVVLYGLLVKYILLLNFIDDDDARLSDDAIHC